MNALEIKSQSQISKFVTLSNASSEMNDLLLQSHHMTQLVSLIKIRHLNRIWKVGLTKYC